MSTVDLSIFIEEDIDSGESIRALVANDEKLKNAVMKNNQVLLRDWKNVVYIII